MAVMYIFLVLIMGAVKLKARRIGSALEPGKRLSGRLSHRGVGTVAAGAAMAAALFRHLMM